MQTRARATALAAVLTVILLSAGACSKSVQTDSGSKGFEQPPVQAEADKAPRAQTEPPSTSKAPREGAVKEEFQFPRGGQETAKEPEIITDTPQVGSLPAETTAPAESSAKSGDVRVSESIAVAKAGPGEAMAEQQNGGQVSEAQAGLMDVFFAFDSWKLSEDGKQALARDADWLKANGNQKLTIEGYCDERGTQAYNLVLGQKRAKAVQGYLTELGIPPTRMAVISYGKDRPFCREQTEDCYQQNRRGHLVVGDK